MGTAWKLVATLMYDNTYHKGVVLYKDSVWKIYGELGEHALLHVDVPSHSVSKMAMKDRKKALNIALRKIKMKGYREAIAKIPKDGWLAKKDGKGRMRIERMLNFQYVGESKGWFYLKTKATL